MSLSQDQIRFSILISQLVLWINEQPGYSCSYGEIERPQEWQNIMVERGKSKTKTGKHVINLAGDLRIFNDGVYLTETNDYEFAGLKWESMDPKCKWGGRFGDNPSTPEIDGWDGNHFQYT